MDYYMRVCKWFLIRHMKYVLFLITILLVLVASLLFQAYKDRRNASDDSARNISEREYEQNKYIGKVEIQNGEE